MDITKVVDVVITDDSLDISVESFDLGAILVYHTQNTDLFRDYASLAEITADGHVAGSAVYRMAQAYFSQQPSPNKLRVIRLTTAVVPTKKITVLTATEGLHVGFDYQIDDGTSGSIDYTVPSSATITTVATAVAALVNAIAALSATSSTADITATGTSGAHFWISNLVNCTVLDQTPNASIATDLTAAEAADGNWYAHACANESKTNADDIEAWTETRSKKFFAQTADSIELTSSNALMAAAKGHAYNNSTIFYTGSPVNFLAVGIMSVMLARDPGSATAALKAVKGAVPDALTTTQTGYIEAQNGNYYVSIKNLPLTFNGQVASGDYIDNRIGIDWLTARIGERVLTLLAQRDKVPYTDPGVRTVLAEARAELKEAVNKGFLVDGTTFVNAPLVADVNPTDKQNRLLPDITGGGDIAGAIQKTQFKFRLSI